MNILEKHNNEVQDNLMRLWDEKKEKLGLGEYSDEIALHIENQNTELLKKIAKGEIERLKNSMELVSNVVYLSNPPQYPWNNNQEIVDGYNKAINDQLTHWQQVLEDLER